MGAARRLARVRREALAACMTCPLCRGLLREATAIALCLHTCKFPLLSPSLAVSVPFVRSSSLSASAPEAGMVSPPAPPPVVAGAHLRAFASFALVSDSSCSLVQILPAIGLASDASSLVPGGWRTRRLSRGLWSCLSSRASISYVVVVTFRRVCVCFPVAGVAVARWRVGPHREPGFRAQRSR
jgi:hypothetical protein